MRPPKTIKLWQLILGGPFLLWAGWDTYKDVSALEEHGGTMYVGRFTKMMYDIGGKWGILLGSWALAAVYFYILWLVIKRDREEKAARATETPAPKPTAAPKAVRATQPAARVSRPVMPPAPPPIVVAPPRVTPTPAGSEPTFLL
jgi:hypothetical protein